MSDSPSVSWARHQAIATTVFETARLRLEPLVASHAAELFELYSDPHMYTFVPQDPPLSQAALETRYRFLETRQSPDGRKGWFNWVIRLKPISNCIGCVQITLGDDNRAQLANEIGVPFWRQGYATEACTCVIAALFASGVTEVWAELDTGNAASIGLLERLGFTRGAFRPNADFFKGRSSDEWTYTLRSPRIESTNH